MITPVTYLKQTASELKKVTWPNQKEVVRLTAVVIILSFIVGLYIGALDFLFTSILNFLLKR